MEMTPGLQASDKYHFVKDLHIVLASLTNEQMDLREKLMFPDQGPKQTR